MESWSSSKEAGTAHGNPDSLNSVWAFSHTMEVFFSFSFVLSFLFSPQKKSWYDGLFTDKEKCVI